MESLGKKPQNYEDIHNKTYIYEQKPVKIDGFNEAKEKEVKECVEKIKIKSREVIEKKQTFFKKRENKNNIKNRGTIVG